MALAVQQSLLEARGGAPLVETARWIEGVMLSEFALGLCAIAVAFIGARMLTGRLPLREGARIVVGCFVVLGAQAIAAAFVIGGSSAVGFEPSLHPSNNESIDKHRPPLPPANFDPYAGASLNQN